MLLVPFALASRPASGQAGLSQDAAQEPGPSLPVAQAEGFMGDWQLNVDFQGQEIAMAMSVVDEGGFVAATVVSPQGNQRITDITRTDAGLDLAFSSQFGPIHLSLSLDGDQLVGKLATETGGFEAKLRGERGDIDLEELAAGGGLFGTPPKSAKLQLGGGEVNIRLPSEESAHALLERRVNGSGELVVLPDSAALKLRTDVDLVFGDERVSGRLGDDGYPGVYSLWISRTGESWTLLVNREADVWGTQHAAAHDVARIPLSHRVVTDAGSALSLSLEPHEGGGLLRVAFAAHEWTVTFAPSP
jgi:hypothetical protein